MLTTLRSRTAAQLRTDIKAFEDMARDARGQGDQRTELRAMAMLDEATALLRRHNLSHTATGRAILAEEDAGKAQPARSLKPGVRRALASSRLGREILRDDYGQTV